LVNSQLKADFFLKKLWARTILNTESLNVDIRTAIATNPDCRKFLDAGEPTNNPKWMQDINGHLCFERKIFVPNSGDLCLKVLRAKHDHILVGHPG